jgi:hypothetical protein
VEKPYNMFYKDNNTIDGLMYKCKICAKHLAVKWHIDNKDRHNTNCNKLYNNNQAKRIKEVIENQHKLPPGIYQVKCMVNGKRYIGKSVAPIRRKNTHFSIHKKITSTNEALQADLRQYGKQSFVFGIIEHCPIELLDERETYYINIYKPEYNQYKTLL